MSAPKSRARLLLIAEFVGVIGLTELLIVAALRWLGPELSPLTKTLLDTLALCLLAGPLLYWRFLAYQRRDPQHTPRTPRRRKPLHNLAFACIAIFIVGSTLALGLSFKLYSEVLNLAEERFDQQIAVLSSDLFSRFDKVNQALKGLAANHAADGGFTSSRFRTYWQAREFASDFPGVRGFGVIERVPRSELAQFTARMRGDRGAQFQIKTAGAAPDLHIITLVEPIEFNAAALGLDIGREPVRRAGLEQAIRNGSPTLTGVITLVQDQRRGPGFLLLNPLYRDHQIPTQTEDRAASHVGFVYCPIEAEAIFLPMVPLPLGQSDFEIYVEESSSPDVLVFDSRRSLTAETGAGAQQIRRQPEFTRTAIVTIANRNFRIQAYSTPMFEAGVDLNRVVVIGIGGVLLSALLSLAFWLAASGRARAELRAQELTSEMKRLALVAERTNNAVTIADADNRIVWVNEAFTKLSGYTLQEARARLAYEVRGEMQDPQALLRIQQALERQESLRLETVNRAKDGRSYWVNLDLQPLRDEAGSYAGYVAVEYDVTEVHQAQERDRQQAVALAAALRESQGLMDAVNTHAIVSETDVAGRIVHVNDAFCAISGYSREELIGQNHRIVNSGLHPDDFWRSMWRTIASGKPWRGLIRNKNKNGGYYWVDSMIAPFKDDAGKTIRYVSIRFDVTAARQTQEELTLERARMDYVLESTSIGTWRANVITGESEVDKGWAAILGYSLEELGPVSPQRWRDLTHPEDKKLADSKMDDYLQGASDIYEVERRLRHKNGQWIWVLTRGIVSARTPDNRVEWLSGTHMDVTERHLLYAEIEQRSNLMAAILENMPGGLCAFDKDLNLLIRNRQFSNMLDMPESLFTQAPVRYESLIRHEAERGEFGPGPVEDFIALAIKNARRTTPTVFERVRPTGEVLEVRAQPLGGGGIVMTIIDVTARKLAEKEAHHADEMLRQAINTLDEAFVIYDAEDRLLLSNQRYRDTYPISAEAMKPGVKFEDIIRYGAQRGQYADAAENVEAWVAERMRRHRQANADLIQELGDGRYLRIIERRTSEGYTVGFRIDVTDLIQAKNSAEKASYEAEQAAARLRAIYDVLPVGLTITDKQGRIIDCNPASERLLGISKAEHLTRTHGGKEWTILREDGSLMPPQEYASVIALTERRPVHDALMQVLTPHNSIWLSVSAMPVTSGELGVVIAYVDVTEERSQRAALVAAKQNAEDASRAKSQFLANMSHEIRTPMNAILGMLSLLGNTELTVRQRDYADKTRGAAESLLGLLNDILDFSKVEAGKMSVESESFRIDHMMDELAVILSSSVGKKPLEVLFDLDARLPAILVGDSLRIKQILINLGGNAIKFTQEGMVVVRIAVLGMQPGQAMIEFSVRDTGIGIAPEHLQRIFEGFSQAEASTTRRFGGTGLGLAISARLVGLMGGQLKVESEAGRGSRFFFRLGLQAPIDGAPIIEPPQEPADQGLHVLIIDDNPVAQQVLQAMTVAMGWVADCAASGEEGLSKIRSRMASGQAPYHAIFVDWLMPGLDGWETSLQIRRLLTGANAPVLVMVTANGRDMLSKRPADEQALVNGFLVKPVTPSMVRDAVLHARHPEMFAATPELTSHTGRLEGMRLLVVEDNKINQQVAQELLEREGAHVTIAENGEQGVQAIAAANPMWDAVLMDVQMPVMDGYTATRKVRQELGLSALPVIAMTANAMESDRQDALAAGMNAHVGKPFKLANLVAVLLEHTGRRTPTQESVTTTPPAPAADLGSAHSGMDAQTALDRLGGDVRVYARILEAFKRDLPNQHPQLETLLAQSQWNDARRHLHTLKGTAATVGATGLAELAAQAEKQLAHDGQLDQERIRALLARLQDQTQAVSAAVTALLSQLQAPAPSARPANQAIEEAEIRNDLRALRRLLRNSDLSSLDAFASLSDRHAAALQSALDPLAEAMASLDFERAIGLCDELLKRHRTST